ncbi:MAG: HlyC/CorC family transporter [Firmicutes bacterium]|nr:HlyC/CorC family transporter [Bacillota bacterium]
MTDSPLLWLLLLQFTFILLNAVFASAEIAVLTLNKNRLIQLSSSGDKRALLLTELTEQPASFLATIQVGITLINLLSSAVATANFSDRLVDWLVSIGLNAPPLLVNILSVGGITLLLTYFTVLLGELIPKRLAMERAEKIALRMSRLIYLVARIFTPAVWLFTVSTNGLLRLMGIDPNSEQDGSAEEEIRLILDAAKEKGTLPPSERSMIHNIFEFDDISAEEIMTHRVEVSILWLDETDEQWEQTITETRYSAYPVCDESPDHVVGVLKAKDYLRLKDRSRENVMKNAVQPAFFIPESVRADVLFRNMQKTKNHFAVVVDDYGGMSGIITMNDLLEQLVGDLDDDRSAPRELPPIERIDSQTWRIRGIAPLDDVAAHLGVELPHEDYDTFGGFVFGLLGTVPNDGSTPELDAYGLTIKVTKIRKRRLETAVVCLSEVSPGTRD